MNIRVEGILENFIISKEARSSEPVTCGEEEMMMTGFCSPFNNIPSMGILSLWVLGFSIVCAFKFSRYQKL